MVAIVRPLSQTPSLKQAVSVPISTAADALGDILDTKGLTLTAVAVSSVWDSATLSFRVGASTGSMYRLMNSTNSRYVVTCTSSQVHYIDPNVFAGFQYIQPESGTTTVPQTTASNITFFLAPIHPIG